MPSEGEFAPGGLRPVVSEVENLSGFVFRCDGSPSIGLGHVLRCQALAVAMKERGHSVHFVTRELPNHVESSIRRAGFDLETICYPRHEPKAELAAYDWQRTEEVARQTGAQAVLVDHYKAAPDYLASLGGKGLGVAVIDDLADRDLTVVDWMLNQNLGASALPYRVRPDCSKLLGPQYALLRPEFAIAGRSLSRRFSTKDQRVLVTLGGGETTQLCWQILSALNLVSRPLAVRCILGGDGPPPTRLAEAAATSRQQVQILGNVAHMAEQMVWADLSINAGGSTCWELCCCGVPMLVLATSPDQVLTASALERQGYASSLGEWEVNAPDLASLVEELLGDPQRRAAMSSKAQRLVDGCGTARAAESLTRLVDRRIEA